MQENTELDCDMQAFTLNRPECEIAALFFGITLWTISSCVIRSKLGSPHFYFILTLNCEQQMEQILKSFENKHD